MGTPNKDNGDPERRTEPAASRHISEHLSNERTYLAFVRTAVALITFGVTANRFSVFLLQSNEVSRNDTIRWNLVDVEKTGLGMVIFGMIIVIWAALEYMRVKRQIDRGDYRPDLRIIWTIAIVIVGGGGFGLLWLFHR
jgi:putative membrane protein